VYHKAGADAILIHSALTDPVEVLDFKRAWGDRCPVLIIPTMYYTTPTEVFRRHGFSLIIWANHLLRAAIAAMQRSAKAIKAQEGVASQVADIASVAEIFRLQRADELCEAEDRYLPLGAPATAAIILAASRCPPSPSGHEPPRAMIRVGGKPLLRHIVDAYKAAGVRDVIVVRGPNKDLVDLPGVSYIDNPDSESTGDLFSLREAMRSSAKPREWIVSRGDALIDTFVLRALSDEPDDVVVILDTSFRGGENRRGKAGCAQCSLPNGPHVFYQKVFLRSISADVPEPRIHGVWTGCMKISSKISRDVEAVLDGLLEDPAGRAGDLSMLLNRLVQLGHPVRALYTSGHWFPADELEDVG
jgi:phosphoenolpyruvate phosphomutase